jgi:hypothetical protein
MFLVGWMRKYIIALLSIDGDGRSRINRWIANWIDLVDFEVYPVMISQAAIDRVTPLL